MPGRIGRPLAGDCRMNDMSKIPTVAHDGTDAEARPVLVVERRVLGLPVSAWPGILAPIVIGILMLCLWELTVRIKGIPSYILPGPLLIVRTLFEDWGTLSEALLITLRIALSALIAA